MSSSAGQRATLGTANSPVDLENEKEESLSAPLRKYVKRLEKTKQQGGNIPFKCNFCDKVFKGSYTRVRCHLLSKAGGGVTGCSKVTADIKEEMKKLIEESELKKKNAGPRHVPLPTSAANVPGSLGFNYYSQQDQLQSQVKKRKGMSGSNPIEKAYQKEAREQCDGEIARMFYSGGLSFHLARNPHFRNSFIRASQISSYVPPSYNALRTTLLQKEKNNVEHQLQPIKHTWKDKGVSLCSDGWTDSQRRPLINFMAACESGPMFLRAINCEGEYKDKHFIAEKLIECIKEIGHQNVVQVVTDNAPVCRAAGTLVEQKYPHIFWTPCIVHTLNLALKDICSPKERDEDVFEQCSWIITTAGDAHLIKVFIMNHSMRLSMFNEHRSLKMLSIAETRFASTIVSLKRLKQIKEGLQKMVISPKWDLYKEDNQGRAKTVKEKILDDHFWDEVDYVLSFTAPIYEMLRLADTDRPCLHLVYEWWETMIDNVKKTIYRKERKQLGQESQFYNVVYGILVKRWTKSSTRLHCLAHSLNPKYYSTKWLLEDPNRVAPHKDVDITMERRKCFERYFFDEEERRKVNVEYASFSMSLNDYSNVDAMKDRYYIEPVFWWGVHGASTPTLQTLAFKLLGQPCSSSYCERNWSTFSFIHSMRRNKITPQRAEDLVFVHTNLRLLSRKNSNYNEGVSQMWDVGADGFDSMDGGSVGMLEIANLSLDEPTLEAHILFLVITMKTQAMK